MWLITFEMTDLSDLTNYTFGLLIDKIRIATPNQKNYHNILKYLSVSKVWHIVCAQ